MGQFEVVNNDGTVKGNPWKCHTLRNGSGVFPHFDPDYNNYSDPEKMGINILELLQEIGVLICQEILTKIGQNHF